MIKNIFIYWNRGFNDCPDMVKKCLSSCKKYNSNYNIVELDDQNIKKYIEINSLLNNKNITTTSLSDIIRIMLLKKYGGIWIDATILCLKSFDDWLLDYVQMGFFAFELKCDRIISSWFIYGEKDNYIIDKWYSSVMDYLKNSFEIGIENCPISTIERWICGVINYIVYFIMKTIFTSIFTLESS